MSELPPWVEIGAKCKWRSEKTKGLHGVVVDAVDFEKRRVLVRFEADRKVWKTVPFSYIGGNGPLQPASASGSTTRDKGKKESKKGASADAEDEDGTKTPPWYEQLGQAETRLGQKEEEKRKEHEIELKKLDRQLRWKEALHIKEQEEARQRDEERKRAVEEAERQRLRIVERLRFEREQEQFRLYEEQFRLYEVACMDREDQLSSTYLNAPARLLERQKREEEERREREFAEQNRLLEEELRRATEQKIMDDITSRPKITFGLGTPPKLSFQAAPAQDSGHLREDQSGIGAQEQRLGQSGHGMEVEEEEDDAPVLDPAALEAAQRWAARYSGAAHGPAHGASQGTARGFGAVQPSTAARQQAIAALDRSAARALDLPPAATGVSPVQYYGARIRWVYEQCNPSKLGEVPGLMEKYRGAEAEMYERICEKYNVTPDPHLPEAPAAPSTAAPPKPRFARKASGPPPPELQSPAARPAPEKRPPESAHAPQKMPAVSSLLERFQNLVSSGDQAEDAANTSHAAVSPAPKERPRNRARPEMQRPTTPPRRSGAAGATGSRMLENDTRQDRALGDSVGRTGPQPIGGGLPIGAAPRSFSADGNYPSGRGVGAYQQDAGDGSYGGDGLRDFPEDARRNGRENGGYVDVSAGGRQERTGFWRDDAGEHRRDYGGADAGSRADHRDDGKRDGRDHGRYTDDSAPRRQDRTGVWRDEAWGYNRDYGGTERGSHDAGANYREDDRRYGRDVDGYADASSGGRQDKYAEPGHGGRPDRAGVWRDEGSAYGRDYSGTGKGDSGASYREDGRRCGRDSVGYAGESAGGRQDRADAWRDEGGRDGRGSDWYADGDAVRQVRADTWQEEGGVYGRDRSGTYRASGGGSASRSYHRDDEEQDWNDAYDGTGNGYRDNGAHGPSAHSSSSSARGGCASYERPRAPNRGHPALASVPPWRLRSRSRGSGGDPGRRTTPIGAAPRR